MHAMKGKMMKTVAVVCLMLLLAIPAGAQKQTELKTLLDSISYSIGVDVGRNFKMQSVDLNIDEFAKGVRDALTGSTLQLSDSVMENVTNAFRRELMAKASERAAQVGAKNKKEGAAFLAENKKKEGVVTLPSGLQYKILKAGSGRKPLASDTIVVNYRGTSIDGKEFDSSFKHGTPATFRLGDVIHGWTEALQLMPIGSTWQLFLPAELAYGDRGMGADIGPHATLIFEVELLAIK
jgi:FKBP-type peptidyl-prolyl cis-trans isomerase FklB